jgi:hypothetical protein
MKHIYNAIAASALACVLASCDRGCVSKMTLGDSPVSSAMAVKQDCPPGLARCVEGAVEITEGRAMCPTCPCTWKRVEVCSKGCVIENVELVRDPERAKSLCKGAHVAATTPEADAGAGECPNEGERFFCHHATVFACPGASAVPVATCTNGCADDGETLAEPSLDIASATALMCAPDRRVVAP